MSTLEDKINKYKENIGKQVIAKGKKLPILKIVDVIKHPFKNKAAYKFENTKSIIECEICTLCGENEQEKNIERLKSYIGKTIYYTTKLFSYTTLQEVDSNDTNIYRIKDILFDTKSNNHQILLDDNSTKESHKIVLFKDPQCYYTDFTFFDKIPKEEWLKLFTTFQLGDEDILCFNLDNGNDDYKVKGFTLTQYSDSQWYLLPILFNTSTDNFNFSLTGFELLNATKRENQLSILERNFYFLLNNRVVELIEKNQKNALKDTSIEIKWIFKKENLFDKLQEHIKTLEAPKNERKSKKKI